ncbi:unnamed protein product [Symbiodinium natans]|uniref:Uncharacterized protein n=1 Tax=Symbiodinium natans TaxID=878477 RepID=A0A812LH55_9DINO|nr:unnamed protein product [Symbiodinium natans]
MGEGEDSKLLPDESWNATGIGYNSSAVWDVSNSSDETLEDVNVTDRMEQNASEVPQNSHGLFPAARQDDVFSAENVSINDSDAWNDTDLGNSSFIWEAHGDPEHGYFLENESADDGNASDRMEENASQVQGYSNGSVSLPDKLLFGGNESANDSDDWNVTELPYNGSLHWEASNASEHREDPAESIELDGNLSDRTDENASEVSGSSNGPLTPSEDMRLAGNASVNNSDGWNETDLPHNSSDIWEASNSSEDLWEDANESVELDGNFSDWQQHLDASCSLACIPAEEDIFFAGNKSANDSDGWNETDLPHNSSDIWEASNSSEDLWEDANESVELDGNFSDWIASTTEVPNNSFSNGTWMRPEEGIFFAGNKSANDSDGWNETDLPHNSSDMWEASNSSEDLWEDANESVELDGNISDWIANTTEAPNNSFSNGTWMRPEEDNLFAGNKSANDSDGWNETDLPRNSSDMWEASNSSEDLWDDANESVELDGNISDWSLT